MSEPIGDCDACAGKPGRKDCMCGGTGKAADAMVYLRKRLIRAEAALEFYADPETYYAIAIVPDPPCGEFMDDFSEVEDGVKKPGKRAREALTSPVPE